MDSDNGTATIWSGAIPDIFILGKEGGVKKRIKSRNLPLGVVDNDTLGSTIEVIALAQGDRLCIFSDGVTEAMRADGEMFEEERLEECLNRYRGNRLLEEIQAAVDKFCGGQSQNDDVTMVVQSIFTMLIMSVIAGILPAWRVSKEDIIKAIWGR